ncbi:MAG: 2-C-methyl-D-erythritol 4-phosphate cytidylyltransferase [bacterium]|nr:2-C-methyl-D-erythritol 4-phosphate cytidylyltransferase [bacterium]
MVWGIIVASGKSKRMGFDKIYAFLGKYPILYYSLQVFQTSSTIDKIILVVDSSRLEYCKRHIIEVYKFSKVESIVKGGAHRQDSVYNGLKVVDAEGEGFVVIHDGARPFLTHKMIKEVIDGARDYGACIPVLKVRDTIKEVDSTFVKSTLDRSNIRIIQTPQAFRKDLIIEGFKHAYKENFYGTDSASLVERLGRPVKIVEGSLSNIKITYPLDLAIAKVILAEQKTDDKLI